MGPYICYISRCYLDGMKQALEAYHQDMLESGKYSSINAVQLWDDLHSFANKCIPSKFSSTRNNLPWVNQKLKRIARQRDRAFQKHRKSGKPADRKKFLDLKHLFRKSIKLSYQSYLEDTLDVASNDLTSKHNTKNPYTSQTFQTRFCLCCTSTQTQFCPSGRPHESHYS